MFGIRRSPLSCVWIHTFFYFILFFSCVCSSRIVLWPIYIFSIHNNICCWFKMHWVVWIVSIKFNWLVVWLCAFAQQNTHKQTLSRAHTETLYDLHKHGVVCSFLRTHYLIAYMDAVKLNWYQNWIHICFFVVVVVVVGVVQIIHTVFARIMMARQQHNDVVEFMINLYKDAEPSRLSTIIR